MFNTQTTTYTVLDIRRTFESFEADLRMIARRTQAASQEWAHELSEDIIKFAENGYLQTVDVILYDEYNKPIRVSKYRVDIYALGWENNRPGCISWPAMPTGFLYVVISYTKDWQNISMSGQKIFKSTLNFIWKQSNIDTSFPTLTRQRSRQYSSNGYGIERSDLA